MPQHEKINYVEFPSRDLDVTKTFFTSAFNWQFTDYGPDYSAFTDGLVNGGFYRSERVARMEEGSALIVLYSADLESSQAKVEESGGTIVTPTFSFPGGRRFHFADPNGNEYAVWSDR